MRRSKTEVVGLTNIVPKATTKRRGKACRGGIEMMQRTFQVLSRVSGGRGHTPFSRKQADKC